MRPVASSLLLVANEADAAHWLPGVPVVGDSHAGAGGLAGVEAALTRGQDAIVVAWDMPFVTPTLIELLWSVARRADADVVVPESDSPYGFEPFCAFYSARVRSSLTDYLESGGGPARDFIARVPRLHRIPLADSARIAEPERLYFSINTPEDLRRARAIISAAK